MSLSALQTKYRITTTYIFFCLLAMRAIHMSNVHQRYKFKVISLRLFISTHHKKYRRDRCSRVDGESTFFGTSTLNADWCGLRIDYCKLSLLVLCIYLSICLLQSIYLISIYLSYIYLSYMYSKSIYLSFIYLFI